PPAQPAAPVPLRRGPPPTRVPRARPPSPSGTPQVPWLRLLLFALAGLLALAGGGDDGDALFLQTRRLAREIPQVVELRAAHRSPLHHLDLGDPGRVQRERPLDAHPVGDASHGEGGRGPPTALPDHH